MNKQVYSNKEFTDVIDRLNHEIQRRGTYKWFDPLTLPSVGIDKQSPLSLPNIGDRVFVDEKTYSVNNTSEGSIEPTRNIHYPAQGNNPAGPLPEIKDPDSSASQFNVDEIKNLLVGLSKITDINLFYGRDELPLTAFRDPQGIIDVLEAAENSELNAPLHESDILSTKEDPNGRVKDQINENYPVKNSTFTYPMENGKYVMLSGESDGEEITGTGLGPANFYDDYGAKPGDDNFHPYNRFKSELVNRDWHDQNNDRKTKVTRIRPGGLDSIRFGKNPRNPQEGDLYPSRPVYGGKEGACNNLCTGLCHVTCDNECSESCSSTCHSRCGNACTATCGNQCTGCSTQCYQTCKTKCESNEGYSCLKAGVKTVKVTTTGGTDGEPALNHVETTYHTCDGCSYSCQFYPNKKTECWDTGCMGRCFASCQNACSESCYGGCTNNEKSYSENDGYKKGKGQGCRANCTMNCIGTCTGVCEGYCVHTCYYECMATCSDNCSYDCSTNCGSGCALSCKLGCTGCQYTCVNGAKNRAEHKNCVGCSFANGCYSQCQSSCDGNCIGIGCRNICGTDKQGACENNCRINCTATSCTSKCSDACSSRCTSCVNTCGFNCGACTASCSAGCSAGCEVSCSEQCTQSCKFNCINSCKENCSGCSNLCYSCVGRCIGICSVKCTNGCSSCSNMCSWWCDSSCNRTCFSDCNSYCLTTCTGTCATFLKSDTTFTTGPERDPIAWNYLYPHPKNRWEERESFRLVHDIPPYKMPAVIPNPKMINITYTGNNKFLVIEMDDISVTEHIQQVLDITDTDIVTNNTNISVNDIIKIWKFKYGKYHEINLQKLIINDFVYIWSRKYFNEFDPSTIPGYKDKHHNMLIVAPDWLKYNVKQSTIHGGVYTFDKEGNIIINEDMVNRIPPADVMPNIDDGGEIFIIEFFYDKEHRFTENDINSILPWEFEVLYPIRKEDKLIYIIQRNKFLFPEEKEELDGKDKSGIL